MSFIMLETMP